MDKVYVVESSWDNGMEWDLHNHGEKLEAIFSTYEKAKKYVLDQISEERWSAYTYDIYEGLYSFERIYDDEDETEYSCFSITETVVQ